MQKMHEIFPNGCSKKQLEDLRSSWFDKYGNPFTEGADWSKVRLLEGMYWALSMLSSCFAYGGTKQFFTDSGVSYKETYYEHYLKGYLAIGGKKKDFDKMLDIQCKHYERSSVGYAGTDSEGCSYNYIDEKDEAIA